MSNQVFQHTLNPSQLNPALLQALSQHAQSQQQQPQQSQFNPQQQQQQQLPQLPPQAGPSNLSVGVNLNGNGGTSQNFNAYHQAFQRLQSQESQKLEQQRLGLNPGAPGAGINGMMGMTQQQQQQYLAMMQGMGAAAGGGGNPHTTQQGLTLQQLQGQMVGGDEQGRRQILQNMLSQQLVASANQASQQQQQQMVQQPPQQPQQPQQQQQQQFMPSFAQPGALPQQPGGPIPHPYQQAATQQQLPPSQQQQYPNPQQQQQLPLYAPQPQHPPTQPSQLLPPQQQQQQQQQPPSMQQQQPPLPTQPNPGLSREQLQAFIKTHPDITKQIQQKYGGNQQGMLGELMRMVEQQRAQQMQQQQQQMQQQQQGQQAPHMVGLNGPQQPQGGYQPQQQQQGPRPGHERMPSGSGSQQGALSGLGSLAQMGGFDQKQFEALQAMKERQQRTGLVTPNMTNNGALPLVSPQQQPQQPPQRPPSQNQFQQQQQPPQQQMQQQQMFTTPQQQPVPQMQQPPPIPQAPQQAAQAMSNAIGLQGMGNQQAQSRVVSGQQAPTGLGAGMLPTTGGSGAMMSNISDVAKGWSDAQLKQTTQTFTERAIAHALNPGDPHKFYLLQFFAEFKRRGWPVPEQAVSVVARALGNPGLGQAVAAMDQQQLISFAAQRIEGINKIKASQQQQAAQLQQQQQQLKQAGTQANPIEIVTPRVESQSFQQQQSTPNLQGVKIPTPQQQPQLPTPTMPSAQTPQLQAQTLALTQQALAQSQQQQGQQQQQQPKNPRAWAGMDFKTEQIPLNEEQFWRYLGQMHLKKNEPLPPPVIEGRPVPMWPLFCLVHKNGGGLALGTNIQAWMRLAGVLSIGTNEAPQGQPPRASQAIANMVRVVYGQVLQPFEDMLYNRFYQHRLSQGNLQTTTNNPAVAAGTSTTPNGLGGVSAQFLDAVGKGPVGGLTEGQKRMLEEARARAQQQMMQPQQQGLTPQGGQAAGLQTPTGLSTPLTPHQAQTLAIKSSPQMVWQWIRSREESMRQRFPKSFTSIAEEDKPRFIAEVRQLVPLAREAQEKMPRFLLLAVDRSPEDVATVTQLVSMYMFIFITLQNAEQNYFAFNFNDLSKLRDPLAQTLNKFNGYLRATQATADGQAHLAKLFAGLDAAQMPPPPPTGNVGNNTEDVAARLPKGLRVEDLKPPPAKRQKGKSGTTGASPANVPTPPEVKTPQSQVAESPSSRAKAAASSGGSNKRKRQSSTAKPPTPAATTAASLSPRRQSAAKLRPLPENALGIVNLSAEELQRKEETDRAKPILDSWRSLTEGFPSLIQSSSSTALANGNGTGNGEASSVDVWAQLQQAVEEYNAAMSAPTLLPSAAASQLAGQQQDDDLFEQFIDTSSLLPADTKPDVVAAGASALWALPTPELWRATSREEDSPESVKTVGSTTGMGVTTGTTTGSGGGARNNNSNNNSTSTPKMVNLNPALLAGEGVGDGSGKGLGLGMGGGGAMGWGVGVVGSPEGLMFNGMVFGGWEGDSAEVEIVS